MGPTGRKPAAYTTLMRFRQASRQFQERARSPQGNTPFVRSDDIVEVQAHEVRSVLRNER